MPARGPTHGFSRAAITASCKTAIRAQLYEIRNGGIEETVNLFIVSQKGYAIF